MTDNTEALPPHPSHATVRDWMPVSEALRLADLWTVGDLDNSGQWRAAIKVLADEARAALAQRQQVPGGWKLVPKAPTQEMTEAGATSINYNGGNARWSDIREAWADMLAAAPAITAVPQAAEPQRQPRLTVRVQSFPESNGKRNWTALLVRVDPWGGLVGNCGGITIARGEFWNRVAYEAECARALLGERDTEPFILDYGDDITTPDQWAGEVKGGRPVRSAPQAAQAQPQEKKP